MKKEDVRFKLSNLFLKIKRWLHHLFYKSNNYLIDENTTISSNHLENEIKTNDLFEEFKMKNDRIKYLIDLQKKYKSGIISENDMSQEDKKELESLYIEQNKELKRRIKNYESKINKLVFNGVDEG